MRQTWLPTPRLAVLSGIAVLPVAGEYFGYPGRWVALGLLAIVFTLAWLDARVSFSGVDFRAGTDLPEVLSNRHGYRHEVYLLWDGFSGRARGELTQLQPEGYRTDPEVLEFDTGDDEAVFERRVYLEGRGELEEPDWRVRLRSNWGLVTLQREFEGERTHRVFPDLSPIKGLTLPSSRKRRYQIGLRLTRQRGEGTEFDHLREFQQGDDIRKVSWRAVAKHRKPIVIESRAEREEAVLVILDAGRLMSTVIEGRRRFEHFLDTAIDLVVTANSQGDRAGLLVFADEILTFVPPGRRYGKVENMLEELYHIFPRKVESNYQAMVQFARRNFSHRGRAVLFTELRNALSSQAAVGACHALSREHQTMIVTMHGEGTRDRLRRPAAGDMQIFQKAVEADAAVQRKQAIQRLRHSGIRIIDSSPERLGDRVIDEYIRMRSSAT